ncbi:hypothetical protein MASR2M79_22190 [Aminivibrio sp.]
MKCLKYKHINLLFHNALILSLAAEIREWPGRHSACQKKDFFPHLRRENRIRTLHASLAIENNTLTLEQAHRGDCRKKYSVLRREIQESNAFKTYESMEKWNPSSRTITLTPIGFSWQA